MNTLQEWEGVVEWIQDDSFGASLLDVSGDVEREQSEFNLDEVSENDRSLIALGAAFRWIIARATNEWGTRELRSFIVFRRLPAWTARDIETAQSRAAALNRKLGFK